MGNDEVAREGIVQLTTVAKRFGSPGETDVLCRCHWHNAKDTDQDMLPAPELHPLPARLLGRGAVVTGHAAQGLPSRVFCVVKCRCKAPEIRCTRFFNL